MSVSRRDIDWKAYDQFQGTDKVFAESIGMDPNNFAQYKRRHLRDKPTIIDVPVETIDLAPSSNGNLPAFPSAHSSTPERISALPVRYDASELDNLRGRVATLEAFVAALQDQQRPSASERTDSASTHQDASERVHEALARLEARLQAVEASTLALPPLGALPAHSNASAYRITPERTEPPTWLNRGMHLATDMAEWIDTYARQHRMEKREVVDLALRTLRGLVASEGATDA